MVRAGVRPSAHRVVSGAGSVDDAANFVANCCAG